MIGSAAHILHSGGRPRHATIRSADATDHLSRCPGHLADAPGGLENATGHSENAPSGLEIATDRPENATDDLSRRPGHPEGGGDGARSLGAARREGMAARRRPGDGALASADQHAHGGEARHGS